MGLFLFCFVLCVELWSCGERQEFFPSFKGHNTQIFLLFFLFSFNYLSKLGN